MLKKLFISILPLFLYSQYHDEIIAVVDRTPILYSDIEETFQFYKFQYPSITVEEEKELKKKILEDIITQKLLLIKAKKDTLINVKDEEVEKALNEHIKNMKEQIGEKEFAQELEREGLTEETLKEKFESQMRDNLFVQKFVAFNIQPKIVVSPDEVLKFYEEKKDSIPALEQGYYLSHILIRIVPSQEKFKIAKEKINSIYNKLVQGGDFGYLALKYSDDRESAQMYGEIGFVQKGILPPPVEEKIFSLKVQEFTEPIKGDFGYYIFKCLGKKEDEVRLAQIVVAAFPDKQDSLIAKKKAEEAREYALKNGFEAGVEKYSDDPLSKPIKGELGFIPEEKIEEKWRKYLSEKKEGEILEPLLGPLGYHIFKLNKFQKGGIPEFSEIQEHIRNLLYQRKIQKEIKKITESMKEEVFVEIKQKFE